MVLKHDYKKYGIQVTNKLNSNPFFKKHQFWNLGYLLLREVSKNSIYIYIYFFSNWTEREICSKKTMSKQEQAIFKTKQTRIKEHEEWRFEIIELRQGVFE